MSNLGALYAMLNGAPRQAEGYRVRPPSGPEDDYYLANPGVAGMMNGGVAGEVSDRTITLNPYSGLSPDERDAVARLEASRLYMQESGFPAPSPTPQQTAAFQGTTYGGQGNSRALGHSVLSRMFAGDPSAGEPSAEQAQALARLRRAMWDRAVNGYGKRPDGTLKGPGWFGDIGDRGAAVTELSIGLPVNGREMDVPSIVPTLTEDELEQVRRAALYGERLPMSIVQKAGAWADYRDSQGLSPFAASPEQAALANILKGFHR